MQHSILKPLLTYSAIALCTLLFQAQTPLLPPETHPKLTPYHIQTLSEITADLRSPVYATREAATALLIQLPYSRLPDIEAALIKEKDEEAIARLTKIATHLYLKQYTPLYGKAALLGMVFHPELIHIKDSAEQMQMAITVAYLHPGFPAAEVLKTGDRLIAANGIPFPESMQPADFRGVINPPPVINPHTQEVVERPSAAGSFVNFTVIRNGRELQLAVQLAGLPESVTNDLESYIRQRSILAEEFANGLKTGRVSEPIVLGTGLSGIP